LFDCVGEEEDEVKKGEKRSVTTAECHFDVVSFLQCCG
jgi:hypothetical protein